MWRRVPGLACPAAGVTGIHDSSELGQFYPDLDPGFLEAHAGYFESLTIAGGAALFRAGEPTDALYVVVSGRLAATTDEGGEPAVLNEIGPGELIGEMSILTGGVRTATVIALRDSRLMRISAGAFVDFMQHHPSVLRQFVQLLVARLSGRRKRRERLATVALLPVTAGVDGADFARALAREAVGTPAIAAVDRTLAMGRFPDLPAALESGRAAAWLAEMESDGPTLLLACDAVDDPWTRFAVRHADRILLLARAAADPSPGAMEGEWGGEAAAAALRGRELVLLHDAGASHFPGTRGWLDRRTLKRHHHVVRGDRADLARLARHLTGTSVGVVFGGGGARAFAEVGVLKALEERGIQADAVGGTSMGAIIAALAALGLDSAGIAGELRRALKTRPFRDFTLPVVAILGGARLGRIAADMFGEARIEDLRRRYFCVASNLTRGGVAVCEAGSLRRWVTASAAIPGVLPPVTHAGDMFVDGALLNNLPADLMASRNSGPVVAINVSDASGPAGSAPLEGQISGWKAAAARIARRGQPEVPGLGAILAHSMLLASRGHAAAAGGRADLCIAPALEGLQVTDWHRLDRLIELGYRAGAEALARWPA